MRARRFVATAAALVAATACPSATPIPMPPEGDEPRRTPSARVPLVFAAHATRPPIDLGRSAARTLMRGGSHDWSELGEPAGTLHLLHGRSIPDAARTTSDRAAIRAVERDRTALAVVSAHAVGPTVRVLTVEGIDPLADPDRYPFTIPGRPIGAISIVTGVGDVMLGGGVDRLLQESERFSAPLRHVRRRLAAADITFGTLESTLSSDGSPQQPFGENFAADPRVLPGLVAAGFDVLSLGNNHVGDYGPRALVQTVDLVRDAGMQPVGAGANGGAAHRPAIVDRNGVRFGFYAFNGRGESPRPTGRTPGAVRLRMAPYDPFSTADLARVVREVRALRRRVDVVIVLPHWGQQYTHRQNADQRRVARVLVESGADAVIGSHPHWVQGVTTYRGGYVAYSLGNFIFSQNIHLPQTRQNLTVEMTFWGARLKRVELVPGVIEDDFAARFLSWRAGREILEDVWRNSARRFRLEVG